MYECSVPPKQSKKSSVPFGTLPFRPSRIAKELGLVATLFDTGFLTGKVAQVEDTGTAHSTTLVDIYLLNKRTGKREDTFHAHAVRNLADSKGLSCSASTALQHNALEVLDSLFVTLFDLVVNRDGIASLKLGKLLALDKGLDKLHYFILSHDF